MSRFATTSMSTRRPARRIYMFPLQPTQSRHQSDGRGRPISERDPAQLKSNDGWIRQMAGSDRTPVLADRSSPNGSGNYHTLSLATLRPLIWLKSCARRTQFGNPHFQSPNSPSPGPISRPHFPRFRRRRARFFAKKAPHSESPNRAPLSRTDLPHQPHLRIAHL